MSTLTDVGHGRSDAAGAGAPGGPAGTVSHPDELLADRTLSRERKREILAAWASDAHAVDCAPMLRQLESGAIVRLEDVMAALRALDGCDEAQASRRLFERRRPGKAMRLIRGCAPPARPRTDEDDDPPPPPAAALRETLLAA